MYAYDEIDRNLKMSLLDLTRINVSGSWTEIACISSDY